VNRSFLLFAAAVLALGVLWILDSGPFTSSRGGEKISVETEESSLPTATPIQDPLQRGLASTLQDGGPSAAATLDRIQDEFLAIYQDRQSSIRKAWLHGEDVLLQQALQQGKILPIDRALKSTSLGLIPVILRDQYEGLTYEEMNMAANRLNTQRQSLSILDGLSDSDLLQYPLDRYQDDYCQLAPEVLFALLSGHSVDPSDSDLARRLGALRDHAVIAWSRNYHLRSLNLNIGTKILREDFDLPGGTALERESQMLLRDLLGVPQLEGETAVEENKYLNGVRQEAILAFPGEPIR